MELGRRNRLFIWNYPNNSTGIQVYRTWLTFWHRASASSAWTEAYFHGNGFHVGVHMFGYGLNLCIQYERRKPYRTLWQRGLARWMHYRR